MFGDLELEFAGFSGEGVVVVVVVVVMVVVVVVHDGSLSEVDGLLGGGSGFSAWAWTCLYWCANADGWSFFGVGVGGECGKWPILY